MSLFQQLASLTTGFSVNETIPTMTFAALNRHPDTYSRAVRDIDVRVRWTEERSLGFTYALRGELAHLHIPASMLPRRVERLWEHTCFEAFVSVKGSSAYYEFNFSPSGEWAAYAFRGYRRAAALGDEKLSPGITVSVAEDGLELDAVIHLDRLSGIEPREVLRLGLCAVIEENNGSLSYWALKHPPGKPDFHHPDAFALEIPPPAKSLGNG